MKLSCQKRFQSGRFSGFALSLFSYAGLLTFALLFISGIPENALASSSHDIKSEIESLCESALDSDSEAVNTAVDRISRFGESSVKLLGEVLLSEHSAMACKQVYALALSKIDSDDAINIVIDAMKSDSFPARMAALEYAELTGDTRLVFPIWELYWDQMTQLYNVEFDMRNRALDVLSTLEPSVVDNYFLETVRGLPWQAFERIFDDQFGSPALFAYPKPPKDLLFEIGEQVEKRAMQYLQKGRSFLFSNLSLGRVKIARRLVAYSYVRVLDELVYSDDLKVRNRAFRFAVAANLGSDQMLSSARAIERKKGFDIPFEAAKSYLAVRHHDIYLSNGRLRIAEMLKETNKLTGYNPPSNFGIGWPTGWWSLILVFSVAVVVICFGLRKRKKSLALRMAMALTPLVAIVIFLELVLTGFGYVPLIETTSPFLAFTNIEYAYENKTLSNRTFAVSKGNYIRYDEIAIKKQVGQVRIAALGASSVHGPEYASKYVFVDLLCDRLNRSRPEKSFRPINAGVGGVCSNDVLKIARDLDVVDPDVLIIYYGHNEYWRADKWLAASKKRLPLLKIQMRLHRARSYSLMARFFVRMRNRLVGQGAPIAPLRLEDYLGDEAVENPADQFGLLYGNMKHNLEQVIRLNQKKDRQVVLMKIAREEMDQYAWGVNELLANLADRFDCPLVDTPAAFRRFNQTHPEQPIFWDGLHFARAGHRIAADALFDKLAEIKRFQ